MTLIQKYFRGQFITPILLSLGALSLLAILTQSLSTIDLVIENRQSAGVFLYITILTLPQLLSIIMPLAVFMAMLYALNRLNVDSELVVSKAAGISPWQIAIPALHIATYAMIAHLIINLVIQPYSFRERRKAFLKISTDVASRMIKVGEFRKISDGITVYISKVQPSGLMQDILIYDENNAEAPVTYMAESGQISSVDGATKFSLFNGTINFINTDNTMNITEFTSYSIDLTKALATDPVLNLKASDRYIHELLNLPPGAYQDKAQKEIFQAEGHMRLATPLYNIALVLLALAFLVRGEYQKLGYGRKIALAATLGFTIRLFGFVLASAAETSPALNIAQYCLPLIVSIFAIWFLLNPNRAKSIFKIRRHSKSQMSGQALQ